MSLFEVECSVERCGNNRGSSITVKKTFTHSHFPRKSLVKYVDLFLKKSMKLDETNSCLNFCANKGHILICLPKQLFNAHLTILKVLAHVIVCCLWFTKEQPRVLSNSKRPRQNPVIFVLTFQSTRTSMFVPLLSLAINHAQWIQSRGLCQGTRLGTVWLRRGQCPKGQHEPLWHSTRLPPCCSLSRRTADVCCRLQRSPRRWPSRQHVFET